MRLLKTDTIDLLLGHEEQPLKYAIFSHTWGKDEVIFSDLVNGNPESKPAYSKVKFACRQAAADDYSCIWIDNCCIDKSSSAELSEAINSMYVWYERADICYAYLADINASTDTDIQSLEFRNHLAKAAWFTRGWTLQELLAPVEMIFFAKDWTVIGNKRELRGALSSITGIDEDILEDPKRMHFASIAKRMSWAADRETTRPEDLAYCLMGIFSVNMPMLYGEGNVRAYLRLQEEIMKQSDDQSIFAWTLSGASDSTKHGLLAGSPSAFKNSSKIMPYEDYEPRRPFQMTNRGLSIELPLSRLNDNTWVAALDCPVPPTYPDFSFLAVYLLKLSEESDQYARTRVCRLTQVRELGAMQRIYIRQAIYDAVDDNRPFPRHIFQLRNIPSAEEYRVIDLIFAPDERLKPAPPRLTTSRVFTSHTLLSSRSTFGIARGANQLTLAMIIEHIPDGEWLAVMLGSSMDFRVGYSAATLSELDIDSKNRFKSFYSYFQARNPDSGGGIELQNHHVRVKIDSLISRSSKYYMVDVEVTANVKEPGLLDILEDFVFEDKAAGGKFEEARGNKMAQVKKSIWGKISTRTR
ncbi:Vegetative incompatibility protein HET-E-1 [Lachnellula cervina]|uniref:Vegetative incompatibility protein HET-E-1 n=1 Tax=Lachnellula cervina TaxID=1316786 RepID=A0A7D8YU02_9HELO|nr:Vegetative incompatibility protein HET-E-1 [Lachnellula cervina]